MGVHVVRNFPPLEGLPLSTRELMREVGLLARERIYQRTIAGKDADGAAFAPYSKGYRELKQSALGKASPVNLQVSGGMLNALAVLDVTEDSVTVGIR